MTCYKNFYNALNLVTSIGGSVVEFSPATRETRVRFPAVATFSLPLSPLLFRFLSPSGLRGPQTVGSDVARVAQDLGPRARGVAHACHGLV